MNLADFQRTASDYRHGGLLAAARQGVGSVEPILSLHPQGAEISDWAHRAEHVPLRRLLTEELRSLEFAEIPGETGEREPGLPSPVAYWQRRRRLARFIEYRHHLRLLPRVWRVIATMAGAPFNDFSSAIGVEAIAGAVAAGRGQSVASLAPLGKFLARTVTLRAEAEDRIGLTPQSSTALIDFMIQQSGDRTGARLARRIGRAVLAVNFRALLPRQSLSMGRVAPGLVDLLKACPVVQTDDPQWPTATDRIMRLQIRAMLRPKGSRTPLKPRQPAPGVGDGK